MLCCVLERRQSSAHSERYAAAFCGGRCSTLIPNSARLRESVLRCILKDLRRSVLIAHVVPQCLLDKSPLKFPDRLTVENVAIHDPAHKKFELGVHGTAPRISGQRH